MKLSDFKISSLKKAAKTLAEALAETKTPLVRDAVIQRFEYTFELSWKTLRRYFKLNNQIDEYNVRNLFREAAKQGLIESSEDWFEYQEARNLTSHTYDENTAEEVYKKAAEFSQAVDQLIKKLENILG